MEGTIQQLFEGHHMNYIECINVDYKSTRKESFYGNLSSSMTSYVGLGLLKKLKNELEICGCKIGQIYSLM